MIQVPTFIRKQTIRKKIFQSFWITSDENFKIIKRIEQENAKKEADQKEKENIKKEAVMKHRKVKAAMKRKQIKNVSKKIKSNPKLYPVLLEKMYQQIARSVKMNIFVPRHCGRKPFRLITA